MARRYTVCHVAAQYGQTAFLYHVALRWGADMDVLDADGRSPLHWAAYKGYGDTIRLLLVMDACHTLADKEGCTPLHWAAIRGNGEACTLLLQVRPHARAGAPQTPHKITSPADRIPRLGCVARGRLPSQWIWFPRQACEPVLAASMRPVCAMVQVITAWL